MLIDIVRLGNLFNFKSFSIVSILKLCFCKGYHHIEGHETCWHVYTQALLKMTGADNGCSSGGAFDRQI